MGLGKSFALATALALSALTGPAVANASYFDYLNCAAYHLARSDYSKKLEQVSPESVGTVPRGIAWYLRVAERLVPKSQMPCGHVFSASGDYRVCVLMQILAPQLDLLRLEHLTALAEQTGGVGPLPECSADAVCAKCEHLPAPEKGP